MTQPDPTTDPADPDGDYTYSVTADDVADQAEDTDPLGLVGDPRFDISQDGSETRP